MLIEARYFYNLDIQVSLASTL